VRPTHFRKVSVIRHSKSPHGDPMTDTTSLATLFTELGDTQTIIPLRPCTERSDKIGSGQT
jgi:hypothetical protein